MLHRLWRRLTADRGSVVNEGHARDITINNFNASVDVPESVEPVSRLHDLPPVPDNFTGRAAQIDGLAAALTGEKPAGVQVIAGLRGIGGIGKSGLAAKVAHSVKHDFPDAHFVLDLGGKKPQPLTPEQALGDVIRRFRPDLNLPPGVEPRQQIYRAILGQVRALILFDDALNTAQVAPLLPPFPSAALITSRAHITLADAPEPLLLKDFERGESLDFLAALLPGEESGARDALAAACCDHPLALKVAAKLYSLERGFHDGLADFAAEIATRRRDRLRLDGDADVMGSLRLGLAALERVPFPDPSRRGFAAPQGDGNSARHPEERAPASVSKDEEAPGAIPSRHPEEVRRTVSKDEKAHGAVSSRHPEEVRRTVSKDDPNTGDTGPSLADRWRDLSVFVLPFDLAGAAALWAVEADAAKEGLRALLARGFVEEEGGGRFALHDLLRDLARQGQGAARFAVPERRHGELFRARLMDAQMTYLSGHDGVLAGLAAYDAMAPEIRAALERAAARLPASVIAGLDPAIQTAETLDCRVKPGNDAGESGDSGDSGLTYALANAGVYLFALRLTAREQAELWAQARASAAASGNRAGEGVALGNLGNAYMQMGEPARAVEAHEVALKISREIGDRRGEGNDLGNLGNAYYVMGEPARAVEVLQKRLEIAREIGDRRGEGIALGNLGNAHSALGARETAIRYYAQRIEVAREIGDRRGEGNALNNMADEYRLLGDFDRARALALEALAICEEIEDPTTDQTRRLLAQIEAGERG